MNLLCLFDFNEGGYSAKRGELCWFIPSVAAWLLDSFPASWTVAPIITVEEVVTEAIEAPPVDKMIRKAGKRKGA